MSFLGIDLGTSGLRVLLLDAAGRPLGSTERDYAVSHPRSGWSEQNPADWIAALEDALAASGARAFGHLAGMRREQFLGSHNGPTYTHISRAEPGGAIAKDLTV